MRIEIDTDKVVKEIDINDRVTGCDIVNHKMTIDKNLEMPVFTDTIMQKGRYMMIFEIDEEEQQKIEKWLKEIRIEDMNFPVLTYSFRPIGNIGMEVIVRERLTHKELDLADESKW